MENAALIAAGLLGFVAAAIHGVAGEILVVRKLSLDRLDRSPFGGPRMTKAMIHVTWHITTLAFLVVGVALLLSATILEGDTAEAVAVLAAAAMTGYAAIAVGLGAAYMRSPRFLFRHLGPATLTLTAALAWAGAL
jgi:hypothetical protein